jgi:ABC-type transport system involved in multi-copper enzyme maturation permease subunit
MAILTIAQLTLKEASRRKLLLALGILTLVVAVLSGWGFHRLLDLPCNEGGHLHHCGANVLRLVSATLLIMLMFMFSFVIALAAAFVAASSISGDIESGIALAVLPRPIRRSDVVLGKWLGLAFLLALYAGIASTLEYVILKVAIGYVPPHPILATLFIMAEGITVLTLTLLGSTRLSGMTCGIIVLVLFGIMWIAGIAGGVGAAFHSTAIQDFGTVSSLIMPTDGLWRAALYNLEPAAMIAVQSGSRESSGNPFLSIAPATTSYLIWCLAWVLAFLAGAIYSFSRREL